MASNYSTNGRLTRCVLAQLDVPIEGAGVEYITKVRDNISSAASVQPRFIWATENKIHVETVSYNNPASYTMYFLFVGLMSEEQHTEFLLRFE